MADTLTVDPRCVMIPGWVLDLPISDRAVRLYIVLATRPNEPLTRAWLAQRCRCSVHTVDRAVRELAGAGVIDRLERHDQLGAQLPSVYRLLPQTEARR